MKTLRDRVKAGAEFLDQREPGWWRKIDLHILAMNDASACILGQTNHSYWEHGEKLGILDEKHRYSEGGQKKAIALGFNLGDEEAADKYSTLAEAWRREIAARKNQQENGDNGQAGNLESSGSAAKAGR